jgi:hypothetical protein
MVSERSNSKALLCVFESAFLQFFGNRTLDNQPLSFLEQWHRQMEAYEEAGNENEKRRRKRC